MFLMVHCYIDRMEKQMIEFIKTWANQIIVAVIISTIFEMLLPNGNNKKYIKMIIGIYVLFTVIQPIATKITGKEINISSLNFEGYIDKDKIETSSENFEDNNSKLIKQAYIDNIISDIQAKIAKKGYNLIDSKIEVNNKDNNYGAIESVVLKIEKRDNDEKETNNISKIKKIEINIDNSSINNIGESKLTDDEKSKLIEYISEEYSVDKTIIIIN